jgi:hypothetical protein
MASRPLFSVGYLFSLAVLNLLTPLDQMFKSNSGTQSTNNEVAEKELQAAVKEFKAAVSTPSLTMGSSRLYCTSS